MNISGINKTHFIETSGESVAVQSQAVLLLAVQALGAASSASAGLVSANEKSSSKGALASSGVSAPKGVGSKSMEEIYKEILRRFQNAGTGSPDAMKALLDYLSTLPKEVLESPEIKELLNKYKTQLGAMFQVLFMLAFMSQSPAESMAWLEHAASVYGNIPGVSEKFAFLKENFQKLVEITTGPNGERVWRAPAYGDNSDGYSWDKNSDLIELLIANGQLPGSVGYHDAPNPFAGMMKEIMDLLSKEFLEKIKAAKDPAQAFLLLMTMFDDRYSSQQSALAYSTDMLTKLTDGIASRMLAFIKDYPAGKNFPSGTAGVEAFKDFIKATSLALEIIKCSPQLESVAKNVKSAIQGIRDIPRVGYAGTFGDAIDTYLVNPTEKNFSDLALCWMAPSTADFEQSIDNNVQQVGALFTGLSKQVSTNLSIVANKDNEVIKLGNAVASAKEGYQSMISSMVRNQRAN